MIRWWKKNIQNIFFEKFVVKLFMNIFFLQDFYFLFLKCSETHFVLVTSEIRACFCSKNCLYFFCLGCYAHLDSPVSWSSLHERSGIDWIDRKIKFQIFPIFIFCIMVTFMTSSLQFSMSFSRKSENLCIIHFITLLIIYKNRIKTEE